jgi:anion-transporting  ArsA/GET3 family ATPase
VNYTVDAIINRRKIIITCGTGGVGKTTLSAAIAIRAAMLGKRVVVITIDPAKRLAHSLGLESLSDHPTDLTDLSHEIYL